MTTIDGVKVDVANQSGTADIYYGQGIDECAARTPSGSPAITLPINQDRYDAPPYSNATSVDGDADGCPDAFELDLARAKTACGDDPWNPHDSDLDFGSTFTILMELVRADVCSFGSPAGVPPIGCDAPAANGDLAGGSYFHCQAALAHDQGGNSISGSAWCYIDNPLTTVNIENVPAGPALPFVCEPIVPGGADPQYCGDGLPGAAPPRPLADNDGDSPGIIRGQLDKVTNTIDLDMCFQGLENSLQGPNIFARAEIDAYTGLGTVDIYLRQAADCDVPFGTFSPASEVNNANVTLDAGIAIGEQDDDYDVDQDGCTTTQELGPFVGDGGQRDPYSKFDHADTNKDGFITIIDINTIAAAFGPVALEDQPLQGEVGPTMTGSVGWAKTQGDNIVTVAHDILGMAARFGDNC